MEIEKGKVVVFFNKKKGYRWAIVTSNNKRISTGIEYFEKKVDCLADFDKTRHIILGTNTNGIIGFGSANEE